MMLRSLFALLLLGALGACVESEERPVASKPTVTRLMGVVAREAHVRVNPALEASSIKTAHAESLVAVNKVEGEWYHVDLGATGGAGDGWMRHDLVAIDPPPGLALKAKVDGAANLRSGPGTYHSRVGTLKSGEIITINERQNLWYRVSDQAGKTGWVQYDMLIVDVAGALGK
jgi:uncharacterized protein YgiM (DUF1202 family)